VRSPKGAFDGEAAEALGGGVVSFVTDIPGQKWFWFDPCGWNQTNAAPALGYERIGLGYDGPVRTLLATELVNLYHIGETSGAVWRPSDVGAALLCSTVGPNRQWWPGPVFNPPGRIYEYPMMWTTSPGVPPVAFELYINYGEFPAAIRPAFIVSERFYLSATPP
jgi:hypothetical protein